MMYSGAFAARARHRDVVERVDVDRERPRDAVCARHVDDRGGQRSAPGSTSRTPATISSANILLGIEISVSSTRLSAASIQRPLAAASSASSVPGAAGQQRRDEGHADGVARAFDHARQHVAAEIVGAEPMRRADRCEHVAAAHRASARQQRRADHGSEHPERDDRQADPARDAEEREPTRDSALRAGGGRRVGGRSEDMATGSSAVPQPRVGEDAADVGSGHQDQIGGAEEHRAGLHQRHVALRRRRRPSAWRCRGS